MIVLIHVCISQDATVYNGKNVRFVVGKAVAGDEEYEVVSGAADWEASSTTASETSAVAFLEEDLLLRQSCRRFVQNEELRVADQRTR